MEKVRMWVSLALAFLLSVTVVSPMVLGATTPGGIPCNEFRPNEPFGVITNDCSKGDDLATELLLESGTLGLMGPFNRTNDTVAGRFAQFVVNEKNASIDSYATWSNGALYQVFDTIMFYDASSFTSTIVGPIFNGTIDMSNIQVQNHPTGIITVVTDKSVRIKLTMSGGVNSSPVDASSLNASFNGAMYVRSDNISSVVMVKQGSLMMAGNRSIIVDLAKGGEMIFRAAPDTSEKQSELLNEVLKGGLLTEYWTVTRDDGAIYSTIAYGNVDFTPSNHSVKLGSWTLKLPRQVAGHVILFHMDKMSLTISGGSGTLLAQNASNPTQVEDLNQIFTAVRNGSNSSLYYQEIDGNSVILALFVPGGSTATEPVDTGGEDTDNVAGLNIPTTWFVIGAIVAIGAVAGAALLLKRSKRK